MEMFAISETIILTEIPPKIRQNSSWEPCLS